MLFLNPLEENPDQTIWAKGWSQEKVPTTKNMHGYRVVFETGTFCVYTYENICVHVYIKLIMCHQAVSGRSDIVTTNGILLLTALGVILIWIIYDYILPCIH